MTFKRRMNDSTDSDDQLGHLNDFVRIVVGLQTCTDDGMERWAQCHNCMECKEKEALQGCMF
ncbi:hypothetical protein KP509_1Z069700 [Ceratopteris richardii]|nr:hypothetical protein KP509_1Z069700 [Ceratopteris richardii]